MAMLKDSVRGFWSGMDRGARTIFLGASVLILAAFVWGIYFIARDDYRVLFSQLADGDAAAIVEALKRQKVPYRLENDGRTVKVPADRVDETRLALMSSNVALSGGIGFEIFDKQGLGATEQSQRVSYQRALQGELSRTITALDGVKQARVHLVLPESSLFKRDKQETTAAVTLTMKPGSSLDRQQIVGVQRLVAASVAGLDPTHVIVTDQRGVTLSSADPVSGGISGVEARLELQRQVENHIAGKISRMLDSSLGAGQAIISVAVALSFDAVKTTTQDVIPARAVESSVVRKRQVVTGGGASPGTAVDYNDANASARSGSSTLEVEYEHGRRVEEVIAAPGAIRRITVGVIVPPRIGEEQQKRIQEFVRVAAGIDELRGDLVSIQSLPPSESQPSPASTVDVQASDIATDRPLDRTPTGQAKIAGVPLWMIVAGALGALVLGGLFGAMWSRPSRASLSEKERNELLDEIRRSLGDDPRVIPMQSRQ